MRGITSPGSVRADLPLHAFVAAYAAAVFLVARAVGQTDQFVPLIYAYYVLPIFAAALVVGVGCWSLTTGAPFAAIRRAGSALAASEGIAAGLLVVSLSVHLGVFTSAKTMLTDIHPFWADLALADLDVAIHGAAPSTLTARLVPDALMSAAFLLYSGAWGLLVPMSVLACILAPGFRPQRSQYLWTYVLMWPLLGNVVAGLGMSAGPLFYAAVTGDSARFAGLLSYLDATLPDIALKAPKILWQLHVQDVPTAGAGISAFPSLHVASATLCALLVARFGVWARAGGILYVCVILVLSVHLGWHYAVDGYFSIAATVLLWVAVGRWLNRPRAAVRVARPVFGRPRGRAVIQALRSATARWLRTSRTSTPAGL